MSKISSNKPRPISAKEFLKSRNIFDNPIITKDTSGRFVKLTSILNAYKRTR